MRPRWGRAGVDGAGWGVDDDGGRGGGGAGRPCGPGSDRFAWHDDDWACFPLAAAVLYELHIGTFTEAGTFDGAIERLDHLATLGVTAIEIMPVATFTGESALVGWL